MPGSYSGPATSGGSAAPLGGGFDLAPDATYTSASPEIGFGTDFAEGSSPLTIRRWGNALGLGAGSVSFSAADVSGYGFYNSPVITLPEEWLPGAFQNYFDSTPPGSIPANNLPPFMTVAGTAARYPGGDAGSAVTSRAIYTLGAGGLWLWNEELADLAAGDTIEFFFRRPFDTAVSMVLLPSGATFTPS
jgi:hypothetical protein